ncbi:MAG: hypothetical protein KC620_04950, partial [Myxococcales bacterium]|nr:hypothetical protein [Myxococcales bacterium]
LRRARAGRRGPNATQLASEAALMVTALTRPMPSGEEKSEWLVQRADLWRSVARELPVGDERRAALHRALADYTEAMTYGDRTENFTWYKAAVGIAEDIYGKLAPQVIAFACSPSSLGEYTHRRNHCAEMEVHAAQEMAGSDPAGAAKLVCKAADHYAVEVPGEGPNMLARRERRKASYGLMCRRMTEEAAAAVKDEAATP